MNKGTKRLALGTTVAALAGYLAGILTAPKSGKETRQDIKDTASQSIAETEKQLKHLHTELNQLLEDAKSASVNAKGKAKDELDELVDKAATAKAKARELLSAVHEGETDDKDLQRALTEASKAIKHLRTYLSK